VHAVGRDYRVDVGGGPTITSIFAAAASRLRLRALEFLRRGEKKRSSAFHSTQIDLTIEFAF
jgi:hypothetical protein